VSTARSGVAARTSFPRWPAWSTVPALHPRDVHVWFVNLDDPGWPEARFARSLSPLERRRAARTARRRDRRDLIIRRGLLRLLLASYLASRPEAVGLSTGASGRPEVVDAAGEPRLRFNCSRSEGGAVIALTAARRVGVDLEALRDVPEAHRIAERWFTPREQRALAAAPTDRRSEVFLRSWTRLEAAVKATGEGLTEGFGQWDPRSSIGAGSVDPRSGRAVAPSVTWSTWTLEPDARYVGTLVVEGAGQRLVCRELVADPGAER
jgi:4'-phosphopantetheinyl transferase